MSAMRHQTVVVVVGKHMTLDDGCAAGFPEKPLPSLGSMDQFFGYESDFGPIVSMRGVSNLRTSTSLYEYKRI